MSAIGGEVIVIEEDLRRVNLPQFFDYILGASETVTPAEHTGDRAECAVKRAAAGCSNGPYADLFAVANEGQIREWKRVEVANQRSVGIMNNGIALSVR